MTGNVLVRLVNAENDDWVDMGSLSHQEAALTLARRNEYEGEIQTKNEGGSTVFRGRVDIERRFTISFLRGDND